MGLHKKLKKLREKSPQAKERILFFSIIFFAGALFIFWLFTLGGNSDPEKKSVFSEMGSAISKTFNNPIYDETFSVPSLKDMQNPRVKTQ